MKNKIIELFNKSTLTDKLIAFFGLGFFITNPIFTSLAVITGIHYRDNIKKFFIKRALKAKFNNFINNFKK